MDGDISDDSQESVSGGGQWTKTVTKFVTNSVKNYFVEQICQHICTQILEINVVAILASELHVASQIYPSVGGDGERHEPSNSLLYLYSLARQEASYIRCGL